MSLVSRWTTRSSLIGLIFILTLSYGFTSDAGPMGYCEPHKPILLKESEEKWLLYICDKDGWPRGLTKNEFYEMYNQSKQNKELWRKIFGIDSSGDVLKELRGLKEHFTIPWEDKDVKVLEDLANLYQTYITPKGLSHSTVKQMKDYKFDFINPKFTAQISKNCKDREKNKDSESDDQTVKADHKIKFDLLSMSCVCDGVPYTNYKDFECINGKLIDISKTGSGSTTKARAPGAPK